MSSNFDFKNFKIRMVSASFIGAIFISSIFLGLSYFAVLMSFVCYFMAKEWYEIAGGEKKDLIGGLVLIFFAILSLLVLRALKGGEFIVFWYFSVIWAFDCFAMIGGKIIGGKKLCEKISPHKTWSGALSGILAAIIVTIIIGAFVDFKAIGDYYIFRFNIVLITIFIAIISHMGDLLESYFKRKYNFKDSGSIIPGHGGVLDRFDSILLSAPTLLILLLVI